MRILRILSLTLTVAFVSSAGATAQQAFVVTRNAVLWSSPSGSHTRLASLAAGDIVTPVQHAQRSGFVRVQTQDETVGWVAKRNVRELDPTEVHQAGVAAAGGGGVTAPDHLTVDAGAFDGCAVTGNPSPNGSQFAALQALNRLKNRSSEPADADIDSSVTIDKLLEPSNDDSNRWSTSKAAEIAAYVYRVIPGGKSETTNCRKGDPAHRDSHIELVRSPDDTAETRRVIVEVTPRWRAAAGTNNVDWSTATLQHTLHGQWVRVRGWLLFDEEHRQQAENTNPGNGSNWRATAWEIHPVSNLTIVTSFGAHP